MKSWKHSWEWIQVVEVYQRPSSLTCGFLSWTQPVSVFCQGEERWWGRKEGYKKRWGSDKETKSIVRECLISILMFSHSVLERTISCFDVILQWEVDVCNHLYLCNDKALQYVFCWREAYKVLYVWSMKVVHCTLLSQEVTSISSSCTNSTALWDVGDLMHQVCAKWRIQSACPCLGDGKPAVNGMSPVSPTSNSFTLHWPSCVLSYII